MLSYRGSGFCLAACRMPSRAGDSSKGVSDVHSAKAKEGLQSRAGNFSAHRCLWRRCLCSLSAQSVCACGLGKEDESAKV